MRLSLKRAAHAVLSRAAYRKFGASRSFFARCGIPQVSPSSPRRVPQLYTGALRSHQRTWAENDGRSPTTAFSSGPNALSVIDCCCGRRRAKSIHSTFQIELWATRQTVRFGPARKAVEGFAHRIRPTYAGANVGHPCGSVKPVTGLRGRPVVSHISQKTSEMWGTRRWVRG